MTRIHATLDEVVSFLDGTMPAREKRRLAAHIDGGCARCGALAAQIKTTLDALNEVPAVPSFADARERALREIRERVEGRGLAALGKAVAARVATLLLDSLRSPAPAGARGGVAPVRHLVFEWEGDRFTIRVALGAEPGTYRVAGQILAAGREDVEVPIHLRPARGRARRTTSRPSGEFLFEGVPPGDYSLVVGYPEGDVVLTGIDLA